MSELRECWWLLQHSLFTVGRAGFSHYHTAGLMLTLHFFIIKDLFFGRAPMWDWNKRNKILIYLQFQEVKVSILSLVCLLFISVTFTHWWNGPFFFSLLVPASHASEIHGLTGRIHISWERWPCGIVWCGVMKVFKESCFPEALVLWHVFGLLETHGGWPPECAHVLQFQWNQGLF